MKGKCSGTFDFNFDAPPEMHSLEGGSQNSLSTFEMKMRLAMKESVDEAGKRDIDPLDRLEIAARMSRKLGREITKSHLDRWIATSTPEHRIHVDALKALCEVIHCFKPMDKFVESCGFKMLTVEEAKAADYGATMLMKEMIDSDVKRIKSSINNAALQKSLQQRIKDGGS